MVFRAWASAEISMAKLEIVGPPDAPRQPVLQLHCLRAPDKGVYVELRPQTEGGDCPHLCGFEHKQTLLASIFLSHRCMLGFHAFHNNGNHFIH